MRIHTDVLTGNDLDRAVTNAGLTGVYVDSVSFHRSNSRRCGIEFRLAADEGPGRRRRNTGIWGAEQGVFYAATYDEHGHWMAQLFEVDPDAIVGPYKGRDDFHAKTKDAYRISR